jgi:hypothetical protein
MALTTDPNDPRLGHGIDTERGPQNEVYLVLSAEERKRGWVRPLRQSYTHSVTGGGKLPCRVSTRMGLALSETYAKDPLFYGATYCVGCGLHLPVGCFTWDADGETVGS